jgi:hypothetical protein
MTAPLTPERLTEIRKWAVEMEQKKDIRYYGTWQQTTELLAEVDHLRAEVSEMADVIAATGLNLYEEEQENARLRLAWQSARAGRKHLRDAVSAGPALPWAAVMADEDLHLFLDDLVSAAMSHWQSDPDIPDRETLQLIEEACARWRTPGGYRSDASEIPAVFPKGATS